MVGFWAVSCWLFWLLLGGAGGSVFCLCGVFLLSRWWLALLQLAGVHRSWWFFCSFIAFGVFLFCVGLAFGLGCSFSLFFLFSSWCSFPSGIVEA